MNELSCFFCCLREGEKCLFLSAFLFLLVCDARTPPILPRSFVATFTNPKSSVVPFTGSWFYDFDHQVQRIDGGNQLSCNRVCCCLTSLFFFFSFLFLTFLPQVNNGTPEYCTTFLTPNYFYVVFPCRQFCCTEASPGLLRPDWLVHDNATFVGREKVLSRTCNVWLAMGSSRNYWLDDELTGFPCLMDDGGYNFTFTSFQSIAIDPAVVAIPSYCLTAKSC
jgi:hypothetical protein